MKRFILIFLMGVMTFMLNAQEDSTKKVTKYKVLTGYSTDIYNQPNLRVYNLYNTGIGFQAPKTTLYGILNTKNVVSDSLDGFFFGNGLEFQYELDFYQKLTKTTDLWVNYAYSNDIHFPKHRIMTRIWQQIPNDFLISGGYNYYRTQDSINIHMANFGVEKYFGRFWMEGRYFVFFKEPQIKFAYQLNSRVFWKDVNYLQLSLTAGAAPDEPWRTDITTATDYQAYSALLGVSTYINKKQTVQLKSGMGYSYEEYQSDVWRNRYVGYVSFLFTIF
jgi:YaiO family outer membrane protein